MESDNPANPVNTNFIMQKSGKSLIFYSIIVLKRAGP